jgi:recombination protein RecT
MEKKPETPFQIIVADLKRQEQQITAALPKHIPADKFNRVLIGVLSTSPEIVKAASASPEARMSLTRECQKAASDGLVLDGREAVLTKFVTKKKIDGKDVYVDELKYMPMVQGVLKRMRNSGEFVSIECEVVYENDFFDIEKGDNSYLKHRPWYVRDKENIHEPGNLRLAYVSALLKDGTRVREIMTRFDIIKVMSASRSKDRDGNPVGPWKQWPEEMWRKSVLHRAAKYLPKSSDKETGESVVKLLDRDAELYDVVDSDTGEVTQEPVQRKPRTSTKPANGTVIEGTVEKDPPRQSTKTAAKPTTAAKTGVGALDDDEEEPPQNTGDDEPVEEGDLI